MSEHISPGEILLKVFTKSRAHPQNADARLEVRPKLTSGLAGRRDQQCDLLLFFFFGAFFFFLVLQGGTKGKFFLVLSPRTSPFFFCCAKTLHCHTFFLVTFADFTPPQNAVEWACRTFRVVAHLAAPRWWTFPTCHRLGFRRQFSYPSFFFFGPSRRNQRLFFFFLVLQGKNLILPHF